MVIGDVDSDEWRLTHVEQARTRVGMLTGRVLGVGRVEPADEVRGEASPSTVTVRQSAQASIHRYRRWVS